MNTIDYLQHALWQYTIHRLKKHVLFVGKADLENIKNMELEGCLVETCFAEGEADHNFSTYQELIDILGITLRPKVFDTIIFHLVDQYFSIDENVIERALKLLDKAGNILILGQTSDFIETHYASLKEENEEAVLYILNHIIDKKSVDLFRIRVKMIRELKGISKYSLGLFGDLIYWEDIPKLADSMYQSYVESYDYEGETLLETKKEIENVMNGEYGKWIPEASLCVKKDGKIISAVFCTLYQDNPFIAYTFTLPEYRFMGYSRRLLEASIESLAQHGYKELSLACSIKNRAAWSLYRKLGFQEVGRSII